MELARAWNHSWVCGEDALDVRVHLARVGAEGSGKHYRRQVRAATSERRDLERRRHALEAGDEHVPVRVQRLVNAAGPDVDDLRLSVGCARDDTRLRAGQRDRLVS